MGLGRRLWGAAPHSRRSWPQPPSSTCFDSFVNQLSSGTGDIPASPGSFTSPSPLALAPPGQQWAVPWVTPSSLCLDPLPDPGCVLTPGVPSPLTSPLLLTDCGVRRSPARLDLALACALSWWWFDSSASPLAWELLEVRGCTSHHFPPRSLVLEAAR